MSHPGTPASIKAPGKYSPLQGYFSTFDHKTSEYERGVLLERFQKLQHKLPQVSLDDFVVRNAPLAPKHTPVFTEFSFTAPPFVEVDNLGRPADYEYQSKPVYGPFFPSGRGGSPDVMLKGQAQDLNTQLTKQLSTDWPKSFLQVFEDHAGALVISFDRTAAVKEGDITAYMNQMAKQGDLVIQYRLTKDTAKWGLLEDDGGTSVFYVFWPPWTTHRAVVPEQLAGPVPTYTKPPHVTNPPMGFRCDPFANMNATGTAMINYNTRVYEKTINT
eukprot:jgi/Chrzof1/3242/Cz12g17030.t1